MGFLKGLVFKRWIGAVQQEKQQREAGSSNDEPRRPPALRPPLLPQHRQRVSGSSAR